MISVFFSCSETKVVKNSESVEELVQLMGNPSYWTIEEDESFINCIYDDGNIDVYIDVTFEGEESIVSFTNSEGLKYNLLEDAKFLILTAIVPLKAQLKKRQEDAKKVEVKIKI